MRRDWIEKRLNVIGRTKAGLAAALGVSRPRVSEIVNGKRKVQEEEIAKLARYLQLPTAVVVARLGRHRESERGEVEPIYIKGVVKAGLWAEEAQWPEDEWEEIYVPLPRRKQTGLYALRVVGPSMNEVFPEGTIVIVEDIHQRENPPRERSRVVCQRVSGGRFETTVKELRTDAAGRYWLWPRSTDPEHQQPIEVPPPDRWDESRDGDGVYVVGIVIGRYQPEPED